MEGGGTTLLSKGAPASSRLNLLIFFLFLFLFFLHKEAQTRNRGTKHGMGFFLPGLTRLQMASDVSYHPLQEVLLAVFC